MASNSSKGFLQKIQVQPYIETSKFQNSSQNSIKKQDNSENTITTDETDDDVKERIIKKGSFERWNLNFPHQAANTQR